MTFPELTGIAIDGATAIVGFMIAAAVYVFKQWWEEAKRISAAREVAYIRFGSIIGKFEASLLLENEAAWVEHFSELAALGNEFDLFASSEVQAASGAYLGAVSRLIAASKGNEVHSVELFDALVDPKDRLVNAMRADVLWLSKPVRRKVRRNDAQSSIEKNTR
ncbi:MAG: hypothetical protein INF48_11275 [Rhodobacter sp.]|nr:hypothetical protein [Rhodobacter sp.]